MTTKLIYKSSKGYPEPGKHTAYDDSQVIDLDTISLNGGFILKMLVFSVDPYLRGMMSVSIFSQADVLNT